MQMFVGTVRMPATAMRLLSLRDKIERNISP
jgi:hypothetical protein